MHVVCAIVMLSMQIVAGHVFVFGAHKPLGQIAARRAVSHGFDVVPVTPRTRVRVFDDGDMIKKCTSAIVDTTAVTPYGIRCIEREFSHARITLVSTSDEAVRAADAVFGCRI